MQMASHGARATTRNASNVIRPPNGPGSRSIHLGPLPRTRAPLHAQSLSQRVVSNTRTLLGKFFTQLTAPGLSAPTGPSSARSLHGVAGRSQGIHQRLSLPVRTSLSRPMQGYYFPRAPRVSPNSVTNLGLGTARNFSTGRTVFQNLVDNVPIAGRAFYEADWQIEATKRTAFVTAARKSEKTKVTSKQRLQAKPQAIQVPETPMPHAALTSAELEHYFVAQAVPNVTTYLLIPLAPTPTSRTPLHPDGNTPPSLLPWADLLAVHHDHELQSLRVSTVFARLDAANVWSKGVTCSAYAQRASIEGVCTILKVEFIGWTKAQVRSILGESGTGWCVLEETRTHPFDEDGDELSDTSSILSGMSGNIVDSIPDVTDHSLVLPALDFSSSFLQASSIPPSPTSEVDIFSDCSSEVWADLSYDASPDWTDAALSEPDRGSVWLGFSSGFASRSYSELEPRETLF